MWALLNSAGAVTALANWAPPDETGWPQIAPDDPRVAAFLAQAPTMIGAYDFINRFAASEQQAVLEASVAAGGWEIALWLHQLAASGTVDVTATAVTNGMGSLVSGGLLTAARSAQILNLGTASP